MIFVEHLLTIIFIHWLRIRDQLEYIYMYVCEFNFFNKSSIFFLFGLFAKNFFLRFRFYFCIQFYFDFSISSYVYIVSKMCARVQYVMHFISIHMSISFFYFSLPISRLFKISTTTKNKGYRDKQRQIDRWGDREREG